MYANFLLNALFIHFYGRTFDTHCFLLPAVLLLFVCACYASGLPLVQSVGKASFITSLACVCYVHNNKHQIHLVEQQSSEQSSSKVPWTHTHTATKEKQKGIWFSKQRNSAHCSLSLFLRIYQLPPRLEGLLMITYLLPFPQPSF